MASVWRRLGDVDMGTGFCDDERLRTNHKCATANTCQLM